MRDWLANIRIEYVIVAVVVLFIARLVLGRYKTSAAKSAAEIVESALIAIVLVFLIIRPFVVQAFYIPSGSMLPTLDVNDQILVNKFTYRFSEPAYGDVIVFKSPPEASGDGQERDFIKRLIGKSGDVIKVEDGAVYRKGNGSREFRRLNEPYLMDPGGIYYEMDPVRVPQGRLFVMGDNRNDSNDSHAWGPLDRDRVIGKAMFRFWPLNRVGIVR